MKYIRKGNEPREFTEWKNKANEDWKPTYDILYADVRTPLHQALMAEQGYICCYCERGLDIDFSHIEHFRPQSAFPELAISYENMLCSCQKPRRKEEKTEPELCGNSRKDWFDETLFISPLDPGCEERFIYTGDGHILPRETTDIAAATTISKLGLNIREMRAMRKGAIDALEADPPTSEELQLLLERDAEGRFLKFYTTIRYLYHK